MTSFTNDSRLVRLLFVFNQTYNWNSSTYTAITTPFFSCIQGLLNAKTKTSLEAHTYICQAISYIQQHYREEISVPQIADVVGLNPVYLSRLFKLDTGKTLSEYLNCYRTECSLALLADTADTIQSISQKVGYSDVRSYIRFFKKYYDMTPSEYRRGAVGK